MKNLYWLLIFCILSTNIYSQTVTDIDGNVYNTVLIGNQVWMQENLRTTHYNDGVSIPLVSSNEDWINLSTPGYCWYDTTGSGYKDYSKEKFGALYNWYTVQTGKLCPVGWKVPSDNDWNILVNNLGGEDLAGGKLKEEGINHWSSPNTGATNISGFTALPCGTRSRDNGKYYSIGTGTIWYTTSDYSRRLYHNNDDVVRAKYYLDYGFSIRCFRNATSPSVSIINTSNLSSTSIELLGEIIDDSGIIVNDHGFCWSTSPNPTILDSHTENGIGNGNFLNLITELEHSTTYYARAYATNAIGIGYSNEISFTTILEQAVPQSSVPSLSQPSLVVLLLLLLILASLVIYFRNRKINVQL